MSPSTCALLVGASDLGSKGGVAAVADRVSLLATQHSAVLILVERSDRLSTVSGDNVNGFNMLHRGIARFFAPSARCQVRPTLTCTHTHMMTNSTRCPVSSSGPLCLLHVSFTSAFRIHASISPPPPPPPPPPPLPPRLQTSIMTTTTSTNFAATTNTPTTKRHHHHLDCKHNRCRLRHDHQHHQHCLGPHCDLHVSIRGSRARASVDRRARVGSIDRRVPRSR
jgi:hypothetical protein